ncbi:MAG: nicotinate-nucleotide adenylyltransferase [Pseudomonadota bacterium]
MLNPRLLPTARLRSGGNPRAVATPPRLQAPNPWRGLRVGILGGSFNPAHDGHRHISLQALRRLRLDYVWWLVSPQNPLKSSDGMASFADRLDAAKTIARHPRILVTDLEQQLGTRYTADTLPALARAFKTTRFTWLMGADNLSQIRYWDRWPVIFHTMPVAVMARAPYSIRACSSLAATRFRRQRLGKGCFTSLAMAKPPAWIFVPIPLHSTSATAIRSAQSHSE